MPSGSRESRLAQVIVLLRYFQHKSTLGTNKKIYQEICVPSYRFSLLFVLLRQSPVSFPDKVYPGTALSVSQIRVLCTLLGTSKSDRRKTWEKTQWLVKLSLNFTSSYPQMQVILMTLGFGGAIVVQPKDNESRPYRTNQQSSICIHQTISHIRN